MRTHDGLELHVKTYGPDAAPLTVVLAHCWTADVRDWHYQVHDLLAAYGHEVRILTWDHRGHGRSDAAHIDTCTIPALARDMGDVIDAYAAEGPLVLAGHSIGGMTMMALAEVRPDIVTRTHGALFVSTSSGRLGTVTLGLPEIAAGRVRSTLPKVLALRAALHSRTRRRRSPAIERQVVRRFLFGDNMSLSDQGLVVDQLINCPPATMEGFYRDCIGHDRLDALAAYDGVPTRVLVGDRDVLTPVSHARRIASGVADARLLIVPGAGHMLPLECADVVSTQLVELVDHALTQRPSLHAVG
jgi:pimeloyl-ACP methyl ester carboxylesterase